MDATLRILQKFKGITVGNYICHACSGSRSGIEYTRKYTLIFLLRGSFRHAAFRHSHLLTSELVLFKKPGFEYEAIHEHYIHDDCFYIEFDEEALHELLPYFSEPVRSFLNRKDEAALLFRSDPWKHFVTWDLNGKSRDRSTLVEGESVTVELILSVLGDADYSISENSVLHDSIDRAKQFMVENFVNDISIDDIADASCVSPFYFSRIFKKNTTLSPHQFLIEIRVRHACRLLLDSRLTVAEIAYSSGFSNADYFVTLFKKRMRLTPTQFREKRVSSVLNRCLHLK